MITARAFAGKHYAVYGLARSGLATVDALLASGARVTAWDGSEKTRDTFRSSRAKSRGAGTTAEVRPSTALGTNEVALVDLDTADLTKFDSLVVTPGLPLNRHPIAARAREAGLEIIGDIELFARARPELPPHKVVGITGTNGKSTTTALIHHILKTAGVPTTMGGNIGLPILSQDPLPEGGVYVLELSSYQIDLTKSLDCDVAVLLNITPDHLDRYDGFAAYADSKARLFGMQSTSNAAVVVGSDTPSRSLASQLAERLYPTSVGTWLSEGVSCGPGSRGWIWKPWKRDRQKCVLFGDGDWMTGQEDWPNLQGPHNAYNAVAAAAAAFALSDLPGVAIWDAVENGLPSFPGLPHRMERVADRKGVLFVNDSKATNPTATAPALAAFKPIRWICGGQAKTDSLDECAPHFGNVASAYTIGEAAALFERLLSPHMPVKNCGKLADAVRQAARDSAPGDTVLLSPACASFDQFADFEDRGDQFKALVGAL